MTSIASLIAQMAPSADGSGLTAGSPPGHAPSFGFTVEMQEDAKAWSEIELGAQVAARLQSEFSTSQIDLAHLSQVNDVPPTLVAKVASENEGSLPLTIFVPEWSDRAREETPADASVLSSLPSKPATRSPVPGSDVAQIPLELASNEHSLRHEVKAEVGIRPATEGAAKMATAPQTVGVDGVVEQPPITARRFEVVDNTPPRTVKHSPAKALKPTDEPSRDLPTQVAKPKESPVPQLRKAEALTNASTPKADVQERVPAKSPGYDLSQPLKIRHNVKVSSRAAKLPDRAEPVVPERAGPPGASAAQGTGAGEDTPELRDPLFGKLVWVRPRGVPRGVGPAQPQGASDPVSDGRSAAKQPGGARPNATEAPFEGGAMLKSVRTIALSEEMTVRPERPAPLPQSLDATRGEAPVPASTRSASKPLDPPQRISVTQDSPIAEMMSEIVEGGLEARTHPVGLDPVRPLSVTPQAAPQTASALATRSLPQLVEAITRFAPGEVDIGLSPEELGHLRLRMQTTDGAMIVHVTAERIETQDLLRRNIDLLAADLKDSGFGDITFHFGDRRADGTLAREEGVAIDATDDVPPLATIGDAVGARLDMRV